MIGFHLTAMASELTKRQEEVWHFVREHQRTHHVPPSTREVARKLGRAQSTALKHLQALARKGRLEKLADGKWGYKGLDSQAFLFSAPVFGSIPAGKPTTQEEHIEEHVAIDPAAFGLRRTGRNDRWLLRVTGDSMVGAGILDGDLVVLVQRDPVPGDVIAALTDDTTSTLKLFVREKGTTILRGANPRVKDIMPQRLESQGVMIGLIRRRKKAA